MATGYEVKMYNDIGRAADALVSIAKSLERLSTPLLNMPEGPITVPPPDTGWARTVPLTQWGETEPKEKQ